MVATQRKSFRSGPFSGAKLWLCVLLIKRIGTGPCDKRFDSTLKMTWSKNRYLATTLSLGKSLTSFLLRHTKLLPHLTPRILDHRGLEGWVVLCVFTFWEPRTFTNLRMKNMFQQSIRNRKGRFVLKGGCYTTFFCNIFNYQSKLVVVFLI